MHGRGSIGLIALLAGSLAIALLGIGCGGGSDEGATADAPPITKVAYIKKADAICRRYVGRMSEKNADFSAKRGGRDVAFDNIEAVEEYSEDILIPEKEREIEELSGLGVPEGDEEEIGAIFDAYDEGIEVAEEDPRRAVNSSFGVFSYSTSLAEKYGLVFCRN
jgi:hypothetical protein